MPHINYHRGESRTFVVRRNNWNTRKVHQSTFNRERRLNGGLYRRRIANRKAFGPYAPYCTCCTWYEPGSRAWKQETSRYSRHVVDKAIIEEGLHEWEEWGFYDEEDF